MSGAIQWTMAKIRTSASRFIVAGALLVSAVAAASDGVEQIDSDTDRVPRLTVIPEYPEIARRDRIEGEVQVCFDISRDGYPQRIAVRKSTNRLFEKTARKAVRKSTWAPLKKGQEVSGVKACRTFRFTLVPVEEDPVQS
jgi:TonB family protein